MTIDLSKYKIKNIKNQTKINGKPITILEFRRANGSKIKRNEMMRIGKALLKDLRTQHEDGYISISIRYPERWYSGSATRLNDDIDYFTANDYDEFDEDPEEYATFRFHFIPLPKAAGGKDKNNDCLINCLKKYVQSFKNKLDAAELKQYLELRRDDPIPIELMANVELYIEGCTHQDYSIFVSGDYEYTSTRNSNKQIHLILSNEHYTINEDKIKKPKCIAHEDKPILMAEFVDDEIVTYNGTKRGTITREQFEDYKKNVMTSKYLLVEKNYSAKVKKLSLEESYETYKNMADTMKVKTYGKFNFYRCGNIKQMALNHFYSLNQAIQPDDITNNEASFIDGATFEALTYFFKDYEGPVHSYDINSHYPSVMLKNFHYFPIKEGEYKTIKTEEIDVKQYGIYRCVINAGSTPHKFFKQNKKSYYTHLDIETAQKLGDSVQMIQDGKPNFLYYSKDKLINGAFLFKNYIEEMYELKKQGVNGAKDLLNILWGALCETNVYKFNATSDQELNIDDAEIKKLSSDSQIRIKCVFYNAKRYKTNYARIKPFILAYGRQVIYHKYNRYEPYVVRIHTDGFYLTEKPDDILTGDKIGNLKYEGCFQVKINSLNKIFKI